MGRLHPKGVLQVYERKGISLVKVYELVGKSVTLVIKRTKMANRCILWLWIEGKRWENILVLCFMDKQEWIIRFKNAMKPRVFEPNNTLLPVF